jgi:hypothetical protein
MRSVKPLLASIALAGVALLPGISRAGILFTENSVHTTTNAGDFTQVNSTTFDALNMNNQNLPQHAPILQIVTDQAGQIQNGTGGSGQAFISAVNLPFGDVVMTPINPPIAGFTTLELNPYADPGPNNTVGTGTFYLIATDNFGNTFTNQANPFTFDSNGQNRFAAVADPGETIVRLEMVVTPASADILKQFRLNYELGSVSPVPEPSTMALAVSGIAGLGLAGLRRLRRPKTAA